jgi:hypothetical protein
MQTLMDQRRYTSYSFLSSVLDGSEVISFTPGGVLFPRKHPGTHWIGVSVSLKAGLTLRLEEKSFATAGDRTPFVHILVRYSNN